MTPSTPCCFSVATMMSAVRVRPPARRGPSPSPRGRRAGRARGAVKTSPAFVKVKRGGLLLLLLLLAALEHRLRDDDLRARGQRRWRGQRLAARAPPPASASSTTAAAFASSGSSFGVPGASASAATSGSGSSAATRRRRSQAVHPGRVLEAGAAGVLERERARDRAGLLARVVVARLDRGVSREPLRVGAPPLVRRLLGAQLGDGDPVLLDRGRDPVVTRTRTARGAAPREPAAKRLGLHVRCDDERDEPGRAHDEGAAPGREEPLRVPAERAPHRAARRGTA